HSRSQNAFPPSSFSGATPKRSMAPLFAAVAVAALILVVGIVALGAWLLLRDRSGNYAVTNGQNGNTANVNLPNKTVTPVPSPSTTANPPPRRTPSPSPSATVQDPDSIRNDVTHRINEWKAAVESLNIDAVMRNYGPTVDYYRHGPSTAEFIRNDKLRA